MKELTIHDIETIIRRDESRVLEVKKTTGEIVAGMQSGCAFLNTEGGWLFFGIHPKTLKILGQDVADQTRQDIAKELRKFVPAIDLFAQYVDVPGRPNQKVIAIWFPAPMGYAAPYTYDSRPYYKVENTTAVMPREMFDERIRLSDPKKFSWELSPCREATLDDIDENTLTAAIRGGIAKGRIPASAADAVTLPERLSPFKVLLPGDALTNGAIALFGKDPYKFFNHCRVRLARFEGTIMDKFRDQAVIDANLFQQLQAIEDFCRKHMFMSGDQDQFDSKNVLTVPLKVVREAALNLLIHRTWWSEGRTPSVNIFDDRVEFMNPGAFPPGTTPADFRHRPHSVLVNEVIANALFKGGKTEGWGRGILDIFTLCKEAGLPEPEYDFVPNFVCLTIRFKNPLTPYLSGGGNGGVNGDVNGGVNDGVKTLSESLKPVYSTVISNPGIKANNVAALLDRPLPTVEKQLATLKKKGLIEYRGSAKTGGYYAK